MSLRRADRDQFIGSSIDHLIRWGLHDAVAGAEPSPQVWARIQRRIMGDAEAATTNVPAWHKALSRYLLSLYLVVRAPWDLSVDNQHRMALASTLAAETSVLNGWGLRAC